MHELSLVDTTFQKEKTEQYYLSIQADLNGFSFCLYDNQQKKHVVFRKYVLHTNQLIENFLKKLEDIFKTDDLLSLPYASSDFMFLSQKSTLIPDAYFDKNLLKSYFEFNHTLDALDEIHYNYIPYIDAYNVFTLHNYVATAVSHHIKGIKFYHQALPFIEKTMEYADARQKQIVAVGLNHVFFDILVCNGNKLKLYNTFQYAGPTDLLYFILFICKQCEIDPAQQELLLSGELSEILTYRDAIREYIPGMKDMKGEGIDLSDGLARIKESKYFNLLNLISCE
ncbi:MAG: DUF3822 family protein [Bacteroidales bacterium]|nr:DUF3822 family protein [Bacteroidales bacterium]